MMKKSFIIYTLHHLLPLEQLYQGGCDVWDMQYAFIIHSLFNDAVGSSEDIVPNNRKINEKIGNDMKVNDCGQIYGTFLSLS
jgi:hypothetical protein